MTRSSFSSWTRQAVVVTAMLCVGAAAQAQKVRFSTSAGDIVVELDADKAPKTVENLTFCACAAAPTHSIAVTTTAWRAHELNDERVIERLL